VDNDKVAFSFPMKGNLIRSNSFVVCMRFSYVGAPYGTINVRMLNQVC
jgi:hypothetical protein